MGSLETLKAAIPEAAKDLRLNLGSVLQPGGVLTPEQTWGVALATALAARNPELRRAVLEEALAAVRPEVVEDARAAAALMGMNNVYYRFRHMVGKPEYKDTPARLRMQRLAQVATRQPDFELFCLAVSAVNGCESCVRSHEEAVLAGGLTVDHVNDAVRIAATIHGVAVALEM
ncbi:MAG TPA: carboxymuconolactone decarboxylase family protein [Myxococcaceae bacterium]|nr:carboxymuconolactone decarboxylase family protein [Myxococcaceae bacterium]